jgi:hypothetical protein
LGWSSEQKATLEDWFSWYTHLRKYNERTIR